MSRSGQVLPKWAEKHRPRRCRACGWRRARERHHWLWHARWRSGRFSPWRRWVQGHGPVVPLCTSCHARISRWDAKPWTALPFVTAAGILYGWFVFWILPATVVLLVFGVVR